MMKKTYNWGIIGPGHIAHKFAHDLLLYEQANLYAVASRSYLKAEAFAAQFKAETYYGSYEELANDQNIDVIYIATPHVYHYEHTMLCLEAGKHVLCEKPFGINAAEVQGMTDKAREKSLFLMDAFWTRFIPATEKMLELIDEGVIGEIKIIKSDFGFKAEYDTEKRLFNKALGGGSLLDIGIYPVFLSLLLKGVPDKISASAVISETGVDSVFGSLFSYSDDCLSFCDSTFSADTATEAWIYGDEGALKLNGPFHHSKNISLYKGKTLDQTFDIDYLGNGYYHEIEEVTQCLNGGLTESRKLPLSLSRDLIQTLDKLRAIIGLEY